MSSDLPSPFFSFPPPPPSAFSLVFLRLLESRKPRFLKCWSSQFQSENAGEAQKAEGRALGSSSWPCGLRPSAEALASQAQEGLLCDVTTVQWSRGHSLARARRRGCSPSASPLRSVMGKQPERQTGGGLSEPVDLTLSPALASAGLLIPGVGTAWVGRTAVLGGSLRGRPGGTLHGDSYFYLADSASSPRQCRAVQNPLQMKENSV